MSKYFNCQNCGLCCGPVPVTQEEFKKIKKFIKKVPDSEVVRLKKQNRDSLTCIFRDIEKDKCSIYSSRPDICRMFGLYEGMECPNNDSYKTKNLVEGQKRMSNNIKRSPVIGILSLSIGWDDVLKGLNK